MLPRFVRAALAGQPLELHFPGTQSRTFVHVHDVARMLAQLMACEEAVGEIVNVGGNSRLSIRHLAQVVLDATHSSSPLHVVEAPYGPGYDNVHDRGPSLEKLFRLIGEQSYRTAWEMVEDVVRDHQGERRAA